MACGGSIFYIFKVKKVLLCLFVLSLVLVGCNFRFPWEPELPEYALVTRVVDGDTIQVGWGETYKVRYIGIDTPEIYGEWQCYGSEAKARNKELVDGKIVHLEYDLDKYDDFDRLLAYVYVDGQMVNEILLLEGYATVATYPPNVKWVNRFMEAQSQAEEADLGLWGECGW